MCMGASVQYMFSYTQLWSLPDIKHRLHHLCRNKPCSHSAWTPTLDGSISQPATTGATLLLLLLHWFQAWLLCLPLTSTGGNLMLLSLCRDPQTQALPCAVQQIPSLHGLLALFHACVSPHQLPGPRELLLQCNQLDSIPAPVGADHVLWGPCIPVGAVHPRAVAGV